MLKKIKNSKGFTLIELLAVIVILGILMIVAIPQITKYIENSRKDTYVDTEGKVHGTLKNVSEFLTFSATADEQSGHYFPFRINNTATNMTIKKNGEPTRSNIEFDKDVVLRTEQNDKWEIYLDSNETPEVKLDFSEATFE